ncbi:hypothetical protein [Litorimonas haliclonae]|uniref:hypothetical protein n=1 Tax=Litorimonas haliclonae TaxID=2081977 RepID=UPI0039EFDA3F
MKRLLTLIAISGLGLAGPAIAQGGPDESLESFCATAPNELLSTIEGSWSLKQGAGVAMGQGFLPIPLMAHPPQNIDIDVDKEAGLASIQQGGEKIVLAPVAPDGVAEIDTMLRESDAEGMIDTSGGCDWYSLPLMVGSNLYDLSADVKGLYKNSTTVILGSLGAFMVCRDSNGPMELARTTSDAPVMVIEEYRELCPKRDLVPDEGELVMTLLVKFNGPNSGSGVLLFEGYMNGAFAGAKAPVTLTRN